MFKSDSEPAIMALKEAVRRELEAEVIREESLVGEHQANGEVENAARQIQGQFRAMKDALDTRYGCRVSGEHCAVPWLVTHAAATITRRRKDAEGMTAHRRWKGREFSRPVAEFGEGVWYLKAGSVGKDKLDNRTGYGWESVTKAGSPSSARRRASLRPAISGGSRS